VEPLKSLLRPHHKSLIFRIHGIGPRGNPVIAKLCRSHTAQIEAVIYGEILPRLRVPSLEFFGSLPSSNQDVVWVFLEDVGQNRYCPDLDEDRHLMAEWMARVHTAAQGMPAIARLPERGALHYLSHLVSARSAIQSARAWDVLARTHRTLLDRLDARLEQLGDSWDELERLCQAMPHTLVHGDLRRKNARFRANGSRRDLFVFDWETSGRGVPGVDLTSSRVDISACCLQIYFSHVRVTWSALRFADLMAMSKVGRIFRLVASADWSAHRFSPDSFEKLMDHLNAYLQQLETEVREPVWSD
jgi:aminoglycoside phosphotransferase (APT) family kinase protein